MRSFILVVLLLAHAVVAQATAPRDPMPTATPTMTMTATATPTPIEFTPTHTSIPSCTPAYRGPFLNPTQTSWFVSVGQEFTIEYTATYDDCVCCVIGTNYQYEGINPNDIETISTSGLVHRFRVLTEGHKTFYFRDQVTGSSHRLTVLVVPGSPTPTTATPTTATPVVTTGPVTPTLQTPTPTITNTASPTGTGWAATCTAYPTPTPTTATTVTVTVTCTVFYVIGYLPPKVTTFDVGVNQVFEVEYEVRQYPAECPAVVDDWRYCSTDSTAFRVISTEGPVHQLKMLKAGNHAVSFRSRRPSSNPIVLNIVAREQPTPTPACSIIDRQLSIPIPIGSVVRGQPVAVNLEDSALLCPDCCFREIEFEPSDNFTIVPTGLGLSYTLFPARAGLGVLRYNTAAGWVELDRFMIQPTETGLDLLSGSSSISNDANDDGLLDAADIATVNLLDPDQ